MITSLIDSVSQWPLGYSLFCQTGFWGPQYSNSFTDIQTVSLSVLFWFSSVHLKQTFNSTSKLCRCPSYSGFLLYIWRKLLTQHIKLCFCHWDGILSMQTEMQSSDSFAHTHAQTHAHAHTHTDSHALNLLQPCHWFRHIAWLWNLPLHSVECFRTWKQLPFSPFLGLR